MPLLEPFEPLGSRAAEQERGPRALVLEVGADRYAVALEQVRVVVDAPLLTRVPDAPRAVLGVVNVRGEVVAVLDTGAALGIHPVGGAPFAAVVETAAGPVGLAASAVPRTGLLGAAIGASELLAGAGRHRVEDEVVVLLDVDALAEAAT
ncbi:MAG TPA: chemotaxis protein CheW [Baekduia sp.]|nr:chemotaxis protein CheW [Baekduia sp.]